MSEPDNKNPTDIHDAAVPRRGPGRPATGEAKSRADIQRDYRQRQREKSITITIDRRLADVLHAQMAVIRDGGSAVLLEPEQAAQLAGLLIQAELKQLKGFVDRPGAKKKG